MTLDEAFRAAIREEVREAVRAELGGKSPGAKALTRRQAEKALGIGRTKLQTLIASGAIKTAKDDPRLVPASEVERFCQPRRQRPRRRTPPAQPTDEGTQNPEALQDALRRRVAR